MAPRAAIPTVGGRQPKVATPGPKAGPTRAASEGEAQTKTGHPKG